MANVNNKHIATFILGALAGLAAGKYASMSDEEKEKMMSNLKDKANNLKDDAVKTADQAKDYFSELKTKGADALKEQFPGAEKWINDIFGKNTGETATAAEHTSVSAVDVDPIVPNEPGVQPDDKNTQI